MPRADAPQARPFGLGCATAVLVLLAALPGCSHRAAPLALPPARLFTGHEAHRRVTLFFPSAVRPGFVQVPSQIYATASMVAQAKQVLMALMAGPPPAAVARGAVACFGPGASFLELYLDGKGLAVVDLPSSTVNALPGGTSSEVAVLYCLVHTLCADIPGLQRVQILVDGAVVESLRGHFDLRDPLTPADF